MVKKMKRTAAVTKAVARRSKAEAPQHNLAIARIVRKAPEPADDPVQQFDNEAEIQPVHAWEVFFRCQRHPMLRHQVLMALMAGTPLIVDRLQKPMLLDVLIIANVTREYFEAEIVDDFQALKERVEEEWAKPDWSCRVFSSQHANWANWILKGEVRAKNREELYIPDMVGWYLDQEPPTYITEEAA